MQLTSPINTTRFSCRRQGQLGFTIVELMIAMPLISLIVVVFIDLLFTAMIASSQNKTQLELNAESQTALSTLERDVRYSSSFLTGLYSPLNDPNAPSGGWKIAGTPTDSNRRVLMLKSLATTDNPLSLNRQPVYIDGSISNPYADADPQLNCSSAPSTGSLHLNPQLPFVTIYFLNGNDLYRRILTDTSTKLCGGASQYQQTSCPTGGPTPCTVKDELVTSDVQEFAVDYYQQNDTPLPTFSLIDPYATPTPDDINLASQAVIRLKLQKTVSNKTVSSNMNLTVGRIN